MNPSNAAENLTNQGILGSLLILALVAIVYLYRELSSERRARIEDAGKFMTLAMSLQEKVIDAVKSLAEIVEKWEKREEDRERLEREMALRSTPTLTETQPSPPRRPGSTPR